MAWRTSSAVLLQTTVGCDWAKERYELLRTAYLTRKCIGVPGESGEWVTSLSSVMQRKGVGESLGAEM